MSLTGNDDKAKRRRTVLTWALLIGGFALVYWTFNTKKANETTKEVPASELYEHIEQGKLAKVTIQGPKVIGKLKPATKPAPGDQKKAAPDRFIWSTISDHKVLVELLRKHKVTYNEVIVDDSGNQMIFSLVKLGIFLVLIIWIGRRFTSQLGGQMKQQQQFTDNKAIQHENVKITFKDVAGIDEAVDDAQDLVEYLKNPRQFTKLGGRAPKGILLQGPPGTGKTLLARAIAGEAKVPFFSISGSEFVEMFVGVGASRVRSLFKVGKTKAPCLIFIDEIDAVGRSRGASVGNSHDEREQTLNQLLVEMDGFEDNSGIIVIAATNRPDILDKGLTRAGRFDRRITVPLPDVNGRERIFAIHGAKLTLASGLSFRVMAQRTIGMSGADIENICNEAALRATKLRKELVELEDFDYAVDKVQLGAERKGITLRESDKRLLAYHEAGHAITGWFTPACDQVNKVTIIPRGMALGLTHFLPEGDRQIMTEQELQGVIVSLLGGRAAEAVLGTASSGAANDLERATAIARQMIYRFGMARDDQLTLRTYGSDQPTSPWADRGADDDYSSATAALLDEAMKQLLGGCWQQAQALLAEHRSKLVALSEALLDRETIGLDELQAILGPRPQS
jgi:cell division protease FtsH